MKKTMKKTMKVLLLGVVFLSLQVQAAYDCELKMTEVVPVKMYSLIDVSSEDVTLWRDGKKDLDKKNIERVIEINPHLEEDYISGSGLTSRPDSPDLYSGIYISYKSVEETKSFIISDDLGRRYEEGSLPRVVVFDDEVYEYGDFNLSMLSQNKSGGHIKANEVKFREIEYGIDGWVKELDSDGSLEISLGSYHAKDYNAFKFKGQEILQNKIQGKFSKNQKEINLGASNQYTVTNVDFSGMVYREYLIHINTQLTCKLK